MSFSKCVTSQLISRTRNAFSLTSRFVARNSIIRSYHNNALLRQPLWKNNFRISTLLRGTGTVAIRLSSDVSNKGKKSVGYWLLACSGMVFVAVVLGTIIYYVELVSICAVLEEVIKKTVK